MPQRQYRKRNRSGGSDEEENPINSGETKRLLSQLEDIRDLQKTRKRTPGMSTMDLAVTHEPKARLEKDNDPLKLKTGGMVDLRAIRKAELNKADIEDDIKQNFSKETQLRDEDEEMRKFVEEELAKRKGTKFKSPGKFEEASHSHEEEVFALPEHLRQYTSVKKEESLSNQMLCGIPEVDLGIDAKIKNIETTEATKLKLLKEAAEKNKNLLETTMFKQDLVKDLQWDYVRHKRFNIQDTTEFGRAGDDGNSPDRKKKEQVAVIGDETPAWIHDSQRSNVRATDRVKEKRPDTRNMQSQDSKMQEEYIKKYMETGMDSNITTSSSNYGKILRK